MIRCLDILYFLVMTEERHHDARSRFFAKSLRKEQLFSDVTRCLIKRCEISLCAFRREQDGRSSAVATARESQQTCSPHRVIAGGLRHEHSVHHKRKHRTGFLIDFMSPYCPTNDGRQL